VQYSFADGLWEGDKKIQRDFHQGKICAGQNRRPALIMGLAQERHEKWSKCCFGFFRIVAAHQQPRAFLGVLFPLPDCPGNYFGSDAGGTFSFDGLPGVLNKRGGGISVLCRKHFMI
jgi:hypothetical protein